MGYKIWNRRYTGSKNKLKEWIANLIDAECVGDSFCDLFAGTGVISERMLFGKKRILINDILYSNNMIYKAFFGEGDFDQNILIQYKERYAILNKDMLCENYISTNFGGKFFSQNDAREIGFIRQDIEDKKDKLNYKEYCILVASLLYSTDKCANTVGHYDAYFTKVDVKDKFKFELIEPSSINDCEIEIFREDANELVRKINCDIVYIDPPYNSRQYSRFYHVLENIAKWEKPELFGTALKPLPENMSEYCKMQASEQFYDLVANLKCKYAVVSYNNTYDSKSNSSKNKISLDFIKTALGKFGTVTFYEKPYQYFNAGKTNFTNHKEYVFILKVGEL